MQRWSFPKLSNSFFSYKFHMRNTNLDVWLLRQLVQHIFTLLQGDHDTGPLHKLVRVHNLLVLIHSHLIFFREHLANLRDLGRWRGLRFWSRVCTNLHRMHHHGLCHVRFCFYLCLHWLISANARVHGDLLWHGVRPNFCVHLLHHRSVRFAACIDFSDRLGLCASIHFWRWFGGSLVSVPSVVCFEAFNYLFQLFIPAFPLQSR